MTGVTIAIATHNRAAELGPTLASLARMSAPPAIPFEVVVIDNRSTDETPEVADRYAPLFGGRLRYVREETQGLSFARNRAIVEASFDIIAYLDDDVDVAAEWLESLWAAYQSGRYAAVGGKAYLVYPTARPQWVGDKIEGYFTRVDHGPEPRPARADELYGVNMSFQASWLRKLGGFRTDVGRVGSCLLGGEDSDMLERVERAGGQILYEPRACVGHRVMVDRLRRTWFVSRSFWGSVAAPRLWGAEMFRARSVGRIVWHMVRAARRTLAGAVTKGPRSAVCFQHFLSVVSDMGLLAGMAQVVLRVTGGEGTRHPQPSELALGCVG